MAEEAKKSPPQGAGSLGSVDFFAVPLTQRRSPSHSPPGVKEATHRT